MVRLALLSLLVALPAHATHDTDGPVTDYSAYTLNQWEIRTGPGRSEVGVFDSLQLGTLELFLLLKVRNVVGKWRAYETGNWTYALAVGVFSLDESVLGIGATIVPIEALVSWRVNDFTYNLGLGFSSVRTSGQLEGDSENEENVGAALELSVGYLHPTVEWRLGPVFALVVESRLGLFQDAAAKSVLKPNERTTLELHGNADASLGSSLWNVSLSGFWSWPHFNVRGGLGYGNYTIPGANLFIPSARFTYPEIALFWRF